MVEQFTLNANWRGSSRQEASGGRMDGLRADGAYAAPAKKRAAIYARKSNETVGKSKSVFQQIEHCKRVAMQHGFSEDEIVVFEEAEGYKGEWYWDDGTGRYPAPYRPVLGDLVHWLEGSADWVFVWRSDRAFRDNGVCDALVQVFRKNGSHLVLGLHEVDLRSSSGLYQAATEAANNRRWRDQISEDIQRDHQFKAELGMFTRNPSCVGFRSKGRGTQEVDPVWNELNLVTRVFRLFVDGLDIATGRQVGPFGTMGIASYLMDQGVLWPKGQKGQQVKYPETIHESQIRTVLTNCMYVGRWRHKGCEYECDRLLVPERDIEGTVVPNSDLVTAIPLSLYEAAQAKLADQKGRTGKRNRSNEHMLTGIAVCGRCGRPLTVHFSAYKTSSKNAREPRRNFYCNHKRGSRPCPSGSARRIQEDVLNAWVLKELAPLLALEMQERATAAGRDASQQALAVAETRLRAAKEKETKKLIALIDVMDAEQFRAVAQALKADRKAIEKQIVDLRTQVAATTTTIPALADPIALASMPTAALKDAISRAVRWMGVGKEGVTVLTSWSTYIGGKVSGCEVR